MDEQLIQSLINSQELIRKTIDDLNKSLDVNNEDLFESIMSINTANSDRLNEEIEKQGIREAQIIKNTLIEINIPQIDSDQIAGMEIDNSIITEETILNLTDTITKLSDILDNISDNKTETTLSENQILGFQNISNLGEANTENIKTLIEDFINFRVVCGLVGLLRKSRRTSRINKNST